MAVGQLSHTEEFCLQQRLTFRAATSAALLPYHSCSVFFANDTPRFYGRHQNIKCYMSIAMRNFFMALFSSCLTRSADIP
jgi:uncharacterized membrane protein YdjX (TVP38/TMEM64 family)